MKDPYDLTQAQKTKSKDVQEEADEKLQREAKRMEEQNYGQTKQARIKLEQAAQKQKGTTDEMRRQGEVIGDAKKSALNVNKNLNKAGELTDDIERESHFFNCGIPCCGSIKKWWKKDRAEEKAVEEIENRKREKEEYAETESVELEDDSDEGKRKTNKELGKILNTVRQVKKEAQVQTNEAKKQTTDLKDIDKLNEYSKKKSERTEAELRKGL